jgi:hypothetical protein
MISHEFVAIDEGHASLLHIDERDAARNWLVPIGHPMARDLQPVGDGRILVGHHHGYSEFDLRLGRSVREFAGLNGVTSARRQPNGHTLLTGVNLAGVDGVVVLELDQQDQQVDCVAFPGNYVRIMRQTIDGTYLMPCNDRIREGTRDGRYAREFLVDGAVHAWKGLRLSNGHLLVSAGYGAFMAELDSNGHLLRRFGGSESLPAHVRPFFYAMFQILQNGNIVVANWQGHGPGLGRSGIQLLEFDAAGNLAWSWSKAEWISSLQGVLVLDGLDTSQLHDERAGPMQSMAPQS